MSAATWLTTTLPIAAALAYRRFLDVESTPRWLPILRSAQVSDRDPDGRPLAAAFMASFERASVGYSLQYRHDPAQRELLFHTPRGSGIRIAGRARFRELGPSACLMEYQLAVESRGLPPWLDPFYDNHAASAVLSRFREYVRS